MSEPGVEPDERRRIVEAAWKVLERSGFQGLKVGSVVRAVPTSTRAFYRWFADKDHLVLELVREELQRAGERMRARSARADDPVAAVRAWIERYVMIAADPALASRARLFSSLNTVGQRYPQELVDAQEGVIAPLRELLAHGVAAGAFPAAQPAQDARAIYHLCAGALTDALRVDDPGYVERAAQETTEFVLRALGAI